MNRSWWRNITRRRHDYCNNVILSVATLAPALQVQVRIPPRTGETLRHKAAQGDKAINTMIRNLTDAFAILCFGWPAIFATIALALAGLLTKRANLMAIAGVIFLPFTYFLSNGLRNPFVVTPLLLFASAFAISRGKMTLAWLLLAPLVLVVLWLAFVVLNQ